MGKDLLCKPKGLSSDPRHPWRHQEPVPTCNTKTEEVETGRYLELCLATGMDSIFCLQTYTYMNTHEHAYTWPLQVHTSLLSTAPHQTQSAVSASCLESASTGGTRRPSRLSCLLPASHSAPAQHSSPLDSFFSLHFQPLYPWPAWRMDFAGKQTCEIYNLVKHWTHINLGENGMPTLRNPSYGHCPQQIKTTGLHGNKPRHKSRVGPGAISLQTLQGRYSRGLEGIQNPDITAP